MTSRCRSLAATAAALLLAAALAPTATSPLAAQSGGEVLRTALDRYEQRMEGVDDYTVVHEVMGFESTVYYEKQTVDGREVFVSRTEYGSEAAERTPDDPYAAFAKLAERARHDGTEEVDGIECHAVTVTDFEGVDLWQPPAASGDSAEFHPERATFFLDTEDYLLRKMTLEGTMVDETGESPKISLAARFRDYREVKGLVHPFLMDVSVKGLQAAMSEDQRKTLESLRQMQKKMEQMPEEQRKMMERMMGERMQQMEQMLGQGAMDVTVKVKEIRVNEGPPAKRGASSR